MFVLKMNNYITNNDHYDAADDDDNNNNNNYKNNNNYYYYFIIGIHLRNLVSYHCLNWKQNEKKINKQTKNKQTKKNHAHLQENWQLIGLKANSPTEMVIGSWIVMSFVGWH